MKRVILIDDHAIVLEGMKEKLQPIPQVKLVGSYGDGETAIADLISKKPDVIITDFSLPGLSGFMLIRKLREGAPDAAILVYTMHAESSFALKAFKAGVSGYLTKDRSLADLESAIEVVLRGERYVSPSLGNKLLSQLCLTEKKDEKFSVREEAVLRAIVDHKTLAEVARELSLSPKTISSYRARIMEKAGVQTNAELEKFAAERRSAQIR